MLFYLLCDLIIALIFIVGSYYGYTRGLFRITARAARLLVCFAFSLGFTPTVSDKIVFPLISQPITGYIIRLAEEKGSYPIGGASEDIPTVMRMAAAIFGYGSAEDAEGNMREVIASLCTPLVSFISTILTFILLMIVSKLLFDLLVNSISGIMDIGVLGIVNRCLGVALSCLLAFIFSWIFATVADFALSSSLVTDGQGKEGQIGPLFGFFRSINPIALLLSF